MLRRAMLLACVLLTSTASAVDAVVYWEETYENGDLSPNWIGSCGFGPGGMGTNGLGCNAVVTGIAPFAGLFSMEANYTGPNPFPSDNPTCGLPQLDTPGCTTLPSNNTCAPGCGAYYDRSHPLTREIWMRFYMRIHNWTSGRDGSKIVYDFGAQDSEPLMLMGGTNPGSPNNAIWAQNVTTGFHTCPNGSVDRTCNYLSQTVIPIVNDRWYCIEFHVLGDSPPGAGNGAIEGFVDSATAFSYTNRIILDGNSFYPTARGPFTQYGQGFRYFDNFAVGNTRIGCSGAPPPDTTPPTLQITAPTSGATFLTKVTPLEGLIWLTVTVGGVVMGGHAFMSLWRLRKKVQVDRERLPRPDHETLPRR